MKTQNNIPVATIEVPSVLKTSLIQLAEIKENLFKYAEVSDVKDCFDDYIANIEDKINDAAYNIAEMLRTESLQSYFFDGEK